MNKKPTSTDSPAGVGVITILMVLSVLALSTFAALTFFSARADMRLSQVNADTVAAYYAAENEAVAQAAAFAADSAATAHNATIPIGEFQELVIVLEKTPQGKPIVRQWQVVVLEDSTFEQPSLPVWGGSK